MKSNYNIYVVYDKVAFMPVRIFIFENDRLALRFFDSAFKVPNSPLLTNVKDTILVNIGSFDDYLKLDPSSASFKVDILNDFNEVNKVDLNGRIVDGYNELVSSLFSSKESNYESKKEF